MLCLLFTMHFYFIKVKVYKRGIITYALINVFEITDQHIHDRLILISTMDTFNLRIYA